jgi:FixJ family two-component response regulator
MSQLRPTIFIVDDDASVLRSIARVVRQAGYEARAFASAEEFLSSAPLLPPQPACLVVDLTMPGIGGLELQRQLAATPAACPVIFISGNGTIPATVQAMKQGAVTFLSKPFDNDDLLRAIAEAVEQHRKSLSANEELHLIRQRLERLTDREREVMAWVITGALNKQIAGQLEIVEKTVKVHRARVLEKMGVNSVAELVRRCAAVGFAAAQTPPIGI